LEQTSCRYLRLHDVTQKKERAMPRYVFATTFGAALAVFACLVSRASAEDAQVARGRYLVTISGCSDCHTPGALLGAPDMKRFLGGSDVGFSVPGQGVFVGENLTPDKETGLGQWTSDQIITAIRAGETPDGRQLSPVMPYPALSRLTDEDAQALVAFLKSLPPVSNKVKNFGPNEKVTINVSAVLPPEVYNALPGSK
jgi:mono/diheme cytochrome c family protein